MKKKNDKRKFFRSAGKMWKNMEDSQKQISRIQLFLDVVVIVVSYLLAWWIQFELVVDENIGMLPLRSMQRYCCF